MDYQEVIELLKNANRSNDMVGILPKSDISKVIIHAMQELQEYRQIGTLEEVREAVEKQKRKKPCISNRCYVCPHCGLVSSLKIKHNYCYACGQHIDWSEV